MYGIPRIAPELYACGHSPLVTYRSYELPTLSLDDRSLVPGIVPVAGSFNVDDISPPIGQEHGAEGAGEKPGGGREL